MARRILRPSLANRIPLVGPLAALIGRLAELRVGRAPVGLLLLLPLAILLDVFDTFDELALGPVGMGASFLLETAFVLGVTGRPGYALGFAAVDLVPGIDVIPVATLTLLARIFAGVRGDGDQVRPDGPVIDV